MPSVCEQLGNFSGNVRVLTTQELLSGLHDGDGTAKAAKHLAEFQTDVAASQNKQVFRQLLQLHDRSGVERAHRIEPGNAGSCRPGAGIDENGVGGQCPRAAGIEPHLDDVGTGEAPFAENELDILGIFQATLVPSAKVVHNCLLAPVNLRPGQRPPARSERRSRRRAGRGKRFARWRPSSSSACTRH